MSKHDKKPQNIGQNNNGQKPQGGQQGNKGGMNPNQNKDQNWDKKGKSGACCCKDGGCRCSNCNCENHKDGSKMCNCSCKQKGM